MLALLWLVYFSFGIAVGSIPPLVSPIADDLGLSYGQMGFVLGAWQLVYIVSAAPLGAMVDRLGIRNSLSLGVLVIFLSVVVRGLAVDFFTIFLAVALFGLGGPIISIGAPKLVAVWFEGRERAIAAGIYVTAPLAGTALALATASSVVVPLTGSWRGISPVYGTVLLIVLGIWWFAAREAPASTRETARGSGNLPGAWSVLVDLLRLRNVQLVLALAFGTFMLNHGLNSWMPTLLGERGMTPSQAGFWTASATGAAALCLLTVAGLARRGSRVTVLALLLVICSVTTVGLTLLSGPALIASVVSNTVVRNLLLPVQTLILMETRGVGAARMGAAAGLFFAAAEIGGFGGPFLLGMLHDATGSLALGIVVLAAVAGSLLLLMPFVTERPVE